MAAVVLADLIKIPQFQTAVLLESLRQSVFVGSGVLVPDADLSRLIQAHVGKTAEFDYFIDLTDVEARISDDSNTIAVPEGITTGSDIAVFNYRNQSWGAKNITASLSATGDPITAIAGRIGAYWARVMDITVMNIVDGIIADNIANDASDMVNDQSALPVGLDLILDTKQTAGDAADSLFGSIIVHSAIRTSLQKQGILDRIYDDSGNYLYEALTGLRVIVKDTVTNAGGIYDSYIVGGGMFAYGEGTPKAANAVETDEATGNGAGQTTLYNRKEFGIHPKGFSFTGVPASTSPTDAEFAAATSWTRNTDRKRIPFALLRSLA